MKYNVSMGISWETLFCVSKILIEKYGFAYIVLVILINFSHITIFLSTLTPYLFL